MRALPLAFLVLSACFIPVARPAGGTTAGGPQYASADPAYGSSSGGTAGSDGASGYAAAPAQADAPAAPAAPTTVSVTIRSACSKTVPVFYGDTPKYGSGTTSSVSSNSVSSHTFSVGDQMWVLDDSGNGAGSVTISSNTRNVEINSSCGGISAR